MRPKFSLGYYNYYYFQPEKRTNQTTDVGVPLRKTIYLIYISFKLSQCHLSLLLLNYVLKKLINIFTTPSEFSQVISHSSVGFIAWHSQVLMKLFFSISPAVIISLHVFFSL